MKIRALGGGAKQQFPHLVGEVKTWLERERNYGHGEQQMDFSIAINGENQAWGKKGWVGRWAPENSLYQ